MKSEEELKQIAKDIVNGQIFTSMQVSQESIPSVFMVLSFLDEESVKKLSKDLGMIYEYYSKALPRGINGNPCFASACTLNKKETTKVITYVKKITDMMESL